MLKKYTSNLLSAFITFRPRFAKPLNFSVPNTIPSLSSLHFLAGNKYQQLIGRQIYYASINSKTIFVNSRSFYTYNRQGGSKSMNPYEVLGVSKDATDKELKVAYFKQAKKYHPDMNPGDKDASANFQKVALAYEILSDPTRRAEYNMYGQTSSQQQDAQYTYKADPASQQKHAEDVFRSVQEDAEVVKEAVEGFIQDIQDEFAYAADAASKGEWNKVQEVVYANKGLIFGVVLPFALIFRFPVLMIWVGRVLLAGSQIVLLGLLRQGNLPRVAHWVWKQIVALSMERNKRKKRRQ